ncbi:hypothetical protein [Synechococcus sp. M16CYN]|uniref:hypothetical protein n=1 Tax=Synechococcus sp. M16CYN TaxID=3103139 RepID=UPI0033402B93
MTTAVGASLSRLPNVCVLPAPTARSRGRTDALLNVYIPWSFLQPGEIIKQERATVVHGLLGLPPD